MNGMQENASEWNSLLMTARAERGPQWDIGTQQYAYCACLHVCIVLNVVRFMVDEFSDLYYDPTPLREYEKEGKSEEPDPQTKTERHSMPAQDLAGSPQIRRGPHSSSQGPPMQFTNSPRHRPQMTPNMPFSNMPPVPAAQFYGNGDMGGPPQIRMSGMSMPIDQMGGMGGGMPGGMGGMGGMGPMANMGGMGGMPGMPGMGGMGGMGMPGAMGMPSPEMRRGMERRMSMGMGNDGFGGMH